MPFFQDIAERFKLLPALGEQLLKSAEAKKTAERAERQYQEKIQPKIQLKEMPKVQIGDISDGFFGDIAKQFNLPQPIVKPQEKPQSFVDPEKAKETGDRFRTVLTEIARTFPREGAGAVMEIIERTKGLSPGALSITPGTGEVLPKEKYGELGPKVEKFLFGDRPVESLTKQGEDVLKGFGVPEESAKKFGLPTGLVFLGIDLIPIGGGGVLKLLSKANKADDVKKILITLKEVDNAKITDEVVNTIAKTTDEKTIKGSIEKLNPEATPTALEPLAQEARKPFSVQEQSRYNSYTHYPKDFNKEYEGIVNPVRRKVETVFGKDIPDELRVLLDEHSKKAEIYLRAEGERMIKAPSPYVVGPANYNVSRTQKANSAFEKKANEFAEFERHLDSKINQLAKARDRAEFSALSETDQLKENIASVERQIARMNPTRDEFFIEKMTKKKVSLEKKLKKLEEVPKSQLTDFYNQAVKGAPDFTSSISRAKASGQSFDEWVKGQGDIPKELSYLSKQSEGVSYETFKRRLVSNIGSVQRGEKIPDDVAQSVFERLQKTAQRGEFGDESTLFKDVGGRNPKRLVGDETITVYRATPVKNLRAGDFVSQDKTEAGFYTSATKKIYPFDVKKSDLVSVEGSMGGGQELIYIPKGSKQGEAKGYFASPKEFWESTNKTRSQLKAEWDGVGGGVKPAEISQPIKQAVLPQRLEGIKPATKVSQVQTKAIQTKIRLGEKIIKKKS